MSDTPETDAELYPMNGVDIVWPDFARKLERERDEADTSNSGRRQDRESAEFWPSLLEQSSSDSWTSEQRETRKVTLAWPSRPGEPQHAWEPPRVVGNAKHNGFASEQVIRSNEAVKDAFNQIPSVLDNKGVKYKKEETDHTSGAWKHSICYSFTINGEEFEIEEHEHTNGKRTLTANINLDPNDDSEYSTYSYITYDDYNMDDFFARLESALKDK